MRKFFPSLSLAISLVAPLFSSLTFWRTAGFKFQMAPFLKESESAALLERGRNLESSKMWREAVNIYETVPSAEKGGRANEFLEAQIRQAAILFKYFNQYTKARSILENLRQDFSDPAIDVYLGQIYYRLALYMEAVDRFEAFLASKKGSVIPQTDQFKRESLFFHASSLDRQYIYVENDPAMLLEAVKAWGYYIDFSGCDSNSKDKDCKTALKRRTALKGMEKKK
jgi:tetratricopeptide (TPR) repeat protein